MAGLSGKTGSVTYAGTAVAEVRSWSHDGPAVGILEDTVLGDENRTYIAGRKDGGTFTVDLQIDLSDAGQDAWVNDILDGTAAAEVAFVGTMATGKTLTAQAIAQGYGSLTVNEDVMLVTGLSVKVTGAVTEAWV